MSKYKYTIVSTYPKLHKDEEGGNVGDKLITGATKRAIRRVKGDAEFATVWRKQEWEAVKEDVYSSDAVIFACLAIRDNMRSVYPYLEEIIESDTPYGILASGTKLRPGQLKLDLYDANAEDIELLKRADEKAMFWGTRGLLTQQFCEQHGIKGAEFTGDIAFTDKRFEHRQFGRSKEIEKIAISDPHYFSDYDEVFEEIIDSLRGIFTDSDINVFLHDKNTDIEDLYRKKEVKYKKLYNKGLDEYDDVDLHVGFRVHGHVSALNRRVYSYTLYRG